MQSNPKNPNVFIVKFGKWALQKYGKKQMFFAYLLILFVYFIDVRYFCTIIKAFTMKKFLMFLILPIAFASCHESLEDKAAREAVEFTRKNCPVPINESVINDSMVYEKETRTIHYFYTIKGKADTTAINLQQAKDGLIKGVKDATGLRAYKEGGFNFAYTYYSAKNKGQKLIDITITPKDYMETE